MFGKFEKIMTVVWKAVLRTISIGVSFIFL